MVGGLTDQTRSKLLYRHYCPIGTEVNDKTKRSVLIRFAFVLMTLRNVVGKCIWENPITRLDWPRLGAAYEYELENVARDNVALQPYA